MLSSYAHGQNVYKLLEQLQPRTGGGRQWVGEVGGPGMWALKARVWTMAAQGEGAGGVAAHRHNVAKAGDVVSLLEAVAL